MNQKLWPALALIATAALLPACNSGGNAMFRQPSSLTPAVAPATGVQTQSPANVPNSPYVLSAQSSGPFINFSVYNMGTTDLQVKQSDFALINAETREVNPYDKANTVIDLPQPSVVKPNETLNGRAIFRRVNSPVGYRLVYKPDSVGTYADVSPASGTGTPTL